MPIQMNWDDIDETENDANSEGGDLEWNSVPEGRQNLVILAAKEAKSSKGDFQVRLLFRHRDSQGAFMEYLTVNPKCRPMVKRICNKLQIPVVGERMFGSGDFTVGLVFNAEVHRKNDEKFGPKNSVAWWKEVNIVHDPKDEKLFEGAGSKSRAFDAAQFPDDDDVPF